MKKIIRLLLMFVIGCSCLSACQANGSSGAAADASGVKIYVSLSQEDTFRNTLVAAACETAEAYHAEITVSQADNSIENQVAQIKQAVRENYDVIMCAAVDADTVQELEALAGEIPIVFFNSCPDASLLEADKYMYVGSDEKVAGQYQAEYLLEKMSSANELNVVLLKGTKNHSATNGRADGVKNTLAVSNKSIHYVFEDYADWEQETAESFFETFLRTGQKADAVLCQNDTMALGVIDACRANGITDVYILGIDATAEGCAAIAAGDMDFTVYQSAKGQGEMAVKAAIALALGNSAEGMEGLSEDGCYIWVPFEKVDSSNVSGYY